jgi:hypothetical protein
MLYPLRLIMPLLGFAQPLLPGQQLLPRRACELPVTLGMPSPCAQDEIARVQRELENIRRRAAGLDPLPVPDLPDDAYAAGNNADALAPVPIRPWGVPVVAPAPAPHRARAPAPAPRIGPPRPPGAPDLPNPFAGRSGLIWTLN